MWAWAFGVALLCASPAAAHPEVEAGRALYAEADLTGALEAFDRAEQATDLTREELAQMLETRVLVHLALGHDEAAQADLERLASFDPQHAFGAETPPEVVRDFDEVRAASGGPVEVRVHSEPDRGAVRIAAHVEHDTRDIVRAVRIHYRVGAADWETAEGEATVQAGGEPVEYWAEAVGPGGAVVATHASAVSPRRVEPAAPVVVGGEAEGGVAPWVWIGGGVLAAGIVVAVIALAASGGGPSDQTQPSYPAVEF